MEKKEYCYEKQIALVDYISFISTFLPIISQWFMVFFAVIIIGFIPPPTTIFYLILYSLGVTIISTIFWYATYIIRKKIKISIGEEEIVYTNRKGTVTIPLNDITQIKFPTTGCAKIISPQKNIRLSKSINDIDDLIRVLKEVLDKKGLSNRYNSKKLYSFHKGAVMHVQFSKRGQRIIWKLGLFILLSGSVAALFATIAELKILEIIIVSFISYLWPLIVCFCTEGIFYRYYLPKDKDKEVLNYTPINLMYEKSLYQKTAKLGTLIYFIVLTITIFCLNMRYFTLF